MTPEQKARGAIDRQLQQCGWVVQSFRDINLSAGLGIAVREFPLKSGLADYLLYADCKALGVIEAKPEGHNLTGVETQSGKYVDGLPDRLPNFRLPLPFAYESTGAVTHFTNALEPDARSREVFTFHRPEELIRLATPTTQTIGFFNGDLVQDYTHEQAVADGVNVGYDVYRIETKISRDGAKLVREPGVFVPHRDRRTKSKKYKELDDDLPYVATQLDRDVVAENQIRLVVRTFKEKLPEIFPGRTEVPKTLVFAKTDLHAEDIVRIMREEFGKGNDFCQKITSKTTGKKPEDLLSEFRNSYNPRIAVTVDMIATGTDVKPLECLLFMRNIRSLSYFEQMKGRGCRVVDPDALQMVTPDAKTKTHFVIVDAVGVCEHEKSATKPLDRKPTVALDKITGLVAAGAADADLVSTLAARLARLDRQLSPSQKTAVAKEACGNDLVTLCGQLLSSIDADAIVEAASRRFHPTRQDAASTIGYFDPNEPIANMQGNLPHFRQPGVTYFVTWRLADSLPQEKLKLWLSERAEWLKRHPEPHTPEAKNEYAQLFTERIQHWLDAGYGECLLARPDVRRIVVDALSFFDGTRYQLRAWVVMPNHVHVLVTPLGEYDLSDILHSWRSFTSKKINRLLSRQGTFWQKEPFDHIVRSPEALERIEAYILANPSGLLEDSYSLSPTLQTRRDAASTWAPSEKQLQQVEQEQMREALKPFHNPKLRNTILAARDSFQIIDESTKDSVLRAGFDAKALENARAMLTSFRQFIEDNKDEIEALKVLYSRPYRAGLRYGQVKELAAAIQKPPHQLHPERLWQAFEAVEPDKVKGHGGKHLVDVIALVKHALDPDTPLAPVATTVEARYRQWLADQEKAGAKFTPEQRRWLDAISDHIANSLSIEQEDFDGVPFSQIGGLGRAYELFGDRLPEMLEDLNARLAA